MKILEQILQEIDKKIEEVEKIIVNPPADSLDKSANDTAEAFIGAYKGCQDIIRSHMEDDGWIPIEEELPPIGKPLIVTIKDKLQGKPNERRYPVYYEKDSMRDGYHWSWRYGDFAYELLSDVSEVIAWYPLPSPYQPKEG